MDQRGKLHTPIGRIINTSIITAFTIAAALIWTDVIREFIKIIVPPGEVLLYKFIAAVIATLFVAVVMYAILKTEHEAEYVIKLLKGKKKQQVILQNTAAVKEKPRSS